MDIVASEFLPPGFGVLRRPPNYQIDCRPGDTAEQDVVVLSLSTNPTVNLHRLCSPSVALLVPSPISAIFKAAIADTTVNIANVCCSNDSDSDCDRYSIWDMNRLIWSFEHVLAVTDAVQVPRSFPVISISPQHDCMTQYQLVDALCSPKFSAEYFCRNHTACNLQEVNATFDDLQRVIKLTKYAVTNKTAILFRPSGTDNLLCNVVLLLPNYSTDPHSAN